MTVLRLELPAKMLPFASEAKRHKIARGGRGSAKSWSIARILAARGVAQTTRWLCCREVQKSIKESSHRLLSNQIAALGLSHLYDIQATKIIGPNGTEFAFVGLQDHTSERIKSYEDFDGAWVEEASKISADSANKLIPTIRNPGSEIWWSYNPDLEDDFIHKMAENPAGDTLVVTINHQDNPWFPDELEKERIKLLVVSQDLHDHIYGGKCRSRAGVIFKRHWFKRFNLGEQPKELNYYLSSDYAGGPDPDDPEADPDWTEHGVIGVDPHKHLWFVDWWSGQEDPAVWISAWIELIRVHKPLRHFEEKGVILRAVDASMRQAMVDSGQFVLREALASAGAKADRALGFAARAATGTVHIPNTQWGDRFIDQLCAFTGEDGRTDDMVDVGSLAARGLDKMLSANEPPKPAEPVDWNAPMRMSDFMQPERTESW